MKFIQTHALKLVQIVHLQIRMSCSSWHLGDILGVLKGKLTKFSTVSTISRLPTCPTWIKPVRTANFILIFRIGTDGFIIPTGRTTEPEPPVTVVSAAAPAEAAAACCRWPEAGCRSERDTSTGIVTAASLDISRQSGELLMSPQQETQSMLWSVQNRKKKQNNQPSENKKRQKRSTPLDKNVFRTSTWAVMSVPVG